VPEHRRRLTWRDRALKELEDLADVILAQPRADLVIGDLRVQHDPQDVVQQRLPVLPAAGALRQRLGQQCPRGRLPAGQRLVE
jgi:hypothetical protein